MVAYLVVSLPNLDRYPPVGEDEPWIAAAPAKLATEGMLGNDLFAGYYSMERHHLQHMPVYPVLEAGVFELFGIGVWQMRVLSVVFGLALLVTVFLVGRQTGDVRVGILALFFLLLLRISGGNGTGILMLDRARVNRYDIAVPVFGLLALWVFNRARPSGAASHLLATGVLAALSSLSHLFGGFWLISILAVIALESIASGQARLRAAALVVAGFAITWIPWMLVVVTHWTDYLGQMKPAGARFDLLDPGFYLRNIVTADGPISIDWTIDTVRALPATRVGTWLMIVGLTLSAALAAVAVKRRALSRNETSLLATAAVHFLLFTAMLAVKTMAYMVALWPLGALVLAWGVARLWSKSGRVVRIAVVVLIALAATEGVTAIARSRTAAAAVSSYSFFTDQIARCIPPDARVLGLQHYWMGLRQFEYRTWLLPINMSRPGWYEQPLTLKDALERVDPGVILIDRYIAAYLSENESPDSRFHQDALDVKQFMDERGARPVCSIRDHTYGPMLVYQLTTR